eukprot:gene6764-6981_t
MKASAGSELVVEAEIQLKLANTLTIKKDGRSYAQQCEDLRGLQDASVFDSAYPKPSFTAQAKAPGATPVPFSSAAYPTDVYTAPVQRPLLNALPRNMTAQQVKAAQRWTMFWRLGCWSTFSWSYFAISCVIICMQSCLGIAMTYHRMLTHHAFKVPKALEYAFAWMGCMSLQESPIAWVSHHRIHHLHTDTPLDPHSPYEGLFHAHCGWLLKADTEQAFLDRSNVPDLTSQFFYRFLEDTWVFPIVVSWNMAWAVNSACHMWGTRPFVTGDLSTNNWFCNLFAFGDGWHNTHHAFPFSARHGLEWYEFDPIWYIVWVLEKVGLAWDVKLPTERDLARRRVQPSRAAANSNRTSGKQS